MALEQPPDNLYRVSQAALNDATAKKRVREEDYRRYIVLMVLLQVPIAFGWFIFFETPFGQYCLSVVTDWVDVVVDWLFA